MQFRRKRQASHLCSAIYMYALEFCKLWRVFFLIHRQEIRSHARCLGCNVVVGYTEDTVIW